MVVGLLLLGLFAIFMTVLLYGIVCPSRVSEEVDWWP